MGSDTRFVPVRTPRSTGIAQTQMVNRPATMGTSGITPPVTASPAASAAVRRQAMNAGSATRVNIAAGTSQSRGAVLPGPPGSAVQSVELLPNVTRNPVLRRDAAPSFTMDELLLLGHLVDTFTGDETTNDENRTLGEKARATIGQLLSRG